MTVTIGRWKLLAALGGAAAAWPLVGRRSSRRWPVGGYIGPASPDDNAPYTVVSRWQCQQGPLPPPGIGH